MNYSPDLAAAAIKMAMALAVVLAMVWVISRVARKVMPIAGGTGSGKLIRVVENQYLGIKKNITMVQVPGEILVLGVTADKIQLLTRLDDPEILKGIDQDTRYPKTDANFKSHLRRFMGAKKQISQLSQGESIAE